MLRHVSSQRLLTRVCSASAAATGNRLFASTAGGDSSAPVHIPVLLHETIALWSDANAQQDSVTTTRYFVDGTAGFGGHSRALLERCADARLLCIDRDSEVRCLLTGSHFSSSASLLILLNMQVLAIAKANLRAFGSRVAFQQGSYVDVGHHLTAADFPSRVDGVLVDLGANSFHFDQPHRGFSWMHDGPLDMRFDQTSDSTPTAAHVLNTHSEVQLTKVRSLY